MCDRDPGQLNCSTTRTPRRRLACLSLSCLSLGLLGLSLTLTACDSKGKPAILPLPEDPVAPKLASIVSSPRLNTLHWPDYSDYQPQVKAFYDSRENATAWVKDHKPTAAARAFIEQFQNAALKGLTPEDYDAAEWPARVQQLSSKDDEQTAAFDAAMTIDVMRYLSNVHQGRINPTHLNFEIDTASKKMDMAQLLRDKAIDAGDVPGLVSSLEPDAAEYRKTEEALGSYLQLAARQAANPQLQQPLPLPASPISPTGHYEAVPQLVARLQLESTSPIGVAADPNAPASSAYTPAIADAVKAFQQTHGLTADGRLTPATVNSLNVPLADRVASLNDSLERWRWLPDQYMHPALMVNLPEFILRGYSGDADNRQEDFQMKVVVGKAEGGHDTPVFTHMMRYLIFRPYWNVPMSIIKKELMAHIAKSGVGYLSAKNFETVNAHGEQVSPTASEVEHGGVIVREKPGASNALGLVKFMFPNQYDIYMHSTNEKFLFARGRRDLSHGCVRVQKPEDLAVWVLRNQSGDWDLDKVTEAETTGPDNHTVSLKTPIPVVIFYQTAEVAEDGQVHFFDDIYGYDREMEQALKRGMPYPSDQVKVNPHTTPGDTT